MARAIARRPIVYWIVTLVAGVLLGVVMVDQLSAAPSGPPGGLEVREQNIDGSGNIKVHEQGIVAVHEQGIVPVADNGGYLSVDDGGGSLTVDDGSGPISVDDAEGSLSVDDNGGSLTVDGSVNVDNFPSAPSLLSERQVFNLDFSESQSLDVPSDAVLTDILAVFSSADGGLCNFQLNSGLATLYEEVGLTGGDHFILNLTTGLQGPLQFRVTGAGVAGTHCFARVTWIGYSPS